MPASFAIIIGLILIWGRIPPVTIVESTTITPQVKNLGYIIVERRIKWIRPDCTKLELTAYVTDSLNPPHLHALGMVLSGRPRYGVTDITRPWQIGRDIPWGPASYQSVLTADCFPFYWIWPVVVELPAVEFEVVP